HDALPICSGGRRRRDGRDGRHVRGGFASLVVVAEHDPRAGGDGEQTDENPEVAHREPPYGDLVRGPWPTPAPPRRERPGSLAQGTQVLRDRGPISHDRGNQPRQGGEGDGGEEDGQGGAGLEGGVDDKAEAGPHDGGDDLSPGPGEGDAGRAAEQAKDG